MRKLEALTSTGHSPLKWEERFAALDFYGVRDRARMNKWRETVRSMTALGFPLRMDVAHLDYTAVTHLTWGPDLGAETKRFRGPPVLAPPETEARAVAKFTGASEEAGNLMRLVKGDYLKNHVGQEYGRVYRQDAVIKGFSENEPCCKIKGPKNPTGPKTKRDAFPNRTVG